MNIRQDDHRLRRPSCRTFFKEKHPMFRRALVVSILVLVVLLGCTRSDERSAASGVAPNFKLQDLSGKPVQLSDFKGKAVVLDFWATWCQPCRDSIPGMVKLQKDYADKGLVILAISLDGGAADDVRAFQKEQGMNYTVLMGTEDVATQYSVRTIPMMIVLDKTGNIQKRFLGAGNEDAIEKTVRQLL
jgi:peroxiredoxin